MFPRYPKMKVTYGFLRVAKINRGFRKKPGLLLVESRFKKNPVLVDTKNMLTVTILIINTTHHIPSPALALHYPPTLALC